MKFWMRETIAVVTLLALVAILTKLLMLATSLILPDWHILHTVTAEFLIGLACLISATIAAFALLFQVYRK